MLSSLAAGALSNHSSLAPASAPDAGYRAGEPPRLLPRDRSRSDECRDSEPWPGKGERERRAGCGSWATFCCEARAECGSESERSDVGVLSSMTAEDEGIALLLLLLVCVVLRTAICACCWRIMLRRRFYARRSVGASVANEVFEKLGGGCWV